MSKWDSSGFDPLNYVKRIIGAMLRRSLLIGDIARWAGDCRHLAANLRLWDSSEIGCPAPCFLYFVVSPYFV